MNIKKANLPNKTAEYFYKISYLNFLSGMPNFWIEDLSIPKALLRTYSLISKLFNLSFYIFVPFEVGAFVTQVSLTVKQESDRWIYCIAHTYLLACIIIIAQQENEIKKWITHILEMKAVYNDPRVEDKMVRKSTLTSSALVLSVSGSMLLHSTSAFMQVIKYEGTFTTIITAWPPVDEQSVGATSVRIITNIVWWLFIIRIISCYIYVISLITCMSFQYENLQSYFHGLDGIFQEDLKQGEMERKYEDGLKIGIKLHSDTFACVDRVKKICGGVLSGQIVYIVIILVFLISQMLRSERTLVNAFATAITAAAVLFGTGLFVWNAGDITIEASNTSTAMFMSGWQNCRGRSSVRVRKLLVIAMYSAQRPVVIKAFGMMDLSYQVYLNLVKTSYSVFSVLY